MSNKKPDSDDRPRSLHVVDESGIDTSSKINEEDPTFEKTRNSLDMTPASGDETETEPFPSSKYESSWVHRFSTPKRCRWNPKAPPPLTKALCYLYAIVRI